MREERNLVRFSLPGSTWQMAFSNEAVSVLEQHAQRRWLQKESVGQLFTRNLADSLIVVDVATVLKPRKSSWASVTFETWDAVAQREKNLKEGLFCFGLWHTHPEPKPLPSGADAALAADHAQAAQTHLTGIVFVIVGNKEFPEGWYVGVHDGTKFRRADSIADLPHHG